jgi:cytoskeleton protein RodZ
MPNEIAADFTPSMTDAKAGPESLSLGAWLAQVRTDYDAEQRDVAHHLGLNPTLIQAIESDDFARLGPPVFVRGYLSRYARLLNLPEAAVLERYRQQTGVGQDPPPLKVVHPRRRQTRVRDLRGLFYLLLIVGVGWTAVQHLGDLDPGKLMALWSSDPSEDRPLIANQPTTTTQTRYPFQSESSGTPATPSQPSPAEPASIPLVPPVTVKSPAPAESPATAEAFSAPAMESTSPASSEGEPAAVALASSAAGSEEHDDDDPVAPSARSGSPLDPGVQRRLLGGSEERRRWRAVQRPDESQYQAPDHRHGTLFAHLGQCAGRPHHPGRPTGRHHGLCAPPRHGQPLHPGPGATLTGRDVPGHRAFFSKLRTP